ncbi:MAG: triose-phosphate isomerase [Longimicrobiales bacterium]
MTKVIAGNWKMNLGPEGARAFFDGLTLPESDARLIVFPPAVSLEAAREAAPREVEIGVQNVHAAASGAFTGETSAEMAAEAGASVALIGHSERRHVFGESDGDTKSKVEAAIRGGLTPVVCVGETLAQRKAGELASVIQRQIAAVRDAVEGASSFMIAYEPVWAIGTGETATPTDASEAHALVRDALGTLGDVPVLYGGSVKPGNAGELLQAKGVDGVLVGGASLDPASFLAIAQAA